MNILPTRIKLMPDYECWCLWDMDSAKTNSDYNLDPQNLPISEELRAKLSYWEDEYDNTLVRENPIDSGFKTREEAKKFNENGWFLWEQLKNEVPSIQFYYFDNEKSELFDEKPESI